MRRPVRAVRRHALPFWRHWNRPMESRWAADFLISTAGALACCLLWKGFWAWWSAAWFTLLVIKYTRVSWREYRKALDCDDQEGDGDRFEVHDRHDIFRRFPWQ